MAGLQPDENRAGYPAGRGGSNSRDVALAETYVARSLGLGPSVRHDCARKTYTGRNDDGRSGSFSLRRLLVTAGRVDGVFISEKSPHVYRWRSYLRLLISVPTTSAASPFDSRVRDWRTRARARSTPVGRRKKIDNNTRGKNEGEKTPIDQRSRTHTWCNIVRTRGMTRDKRRRDRPAADDECSARPWITWGTYTARAVSTAYDRGDDDGGNRAYRVRRRPI